MNNLPDNYFVFNSIGIIHSPYKNKAPNQPLVNDQGEFKIVLNKKYSEGLKLLNTFTYIYVIYYLDKVIRNNKLIDMKINHENIIDIKDCTCCSDNYHSFRRDGDKGNDLWRCFNKIEESCLNYTPS